MAEKKKRKGRRAYLNDIYTDVNGRAVYTGKMFTYDGPLPYGAARSRICLYCGAVLLCVVAVGVLPAPAMLGYGKFYVTLPFMLEALGVFLMLWAAIRMLYHGASLRAYIHEATVKKLPWWLEMTAVFAGLSVVGNVIYLALHGFGGQVVVSLAVIVFQVLAALLALLGRRFVGAMEWRGGEEALPPGQPDR